jgi:hypothetical protein
MVHYPKYVRRARQWVITTTFENPKLKKMAQSQEWFSTEAVAIARWRELTSKK